MGRHRSWRFSCRCLLIHILHLTEIEYSTWCAENPSVRDFFFFALSASSTTMPCVQPQRFFLSSNWAVLRRIQIIPQHASQVALVVKNLPAIARGPRRHRFNPWVRNIPWRGKWLPTPVFLPGKSHGQSSLMGCSSWGLKVRHNWAHTYTHTQLLSSWLKCSMFVLHGIIHSGIPLLKLLPQTGNRGSERESDQIRAWKTVC